jgi:alpha-L-arabinofuranosidase
VREKQLTLTVVNPDATTAREAEIVIRGADGKSATVTMLADKHIHAHNTFGTPDAVRPRTQTIAADGRGYRIVFPPASVSAVTVTLA